MNRPAPHPPTIVTTIDAVRAEVAEARASGRRIGFVPTMGALHAGHVSLVEAAKRDGCHAVVSIYVNPTQFGPNEDYTRYPRALDADAAICAEAGVDLMFAPVDGEMYPPGDQTRVRPGPLAEELCGVLRPGHFEGVCTIVAKLFNIVQPDVAYFGQKDAQQALLIRRMVEDLRFPIRIEVCPIVREPDGLAMSSRNAYLTLDARTRGLSLYRALAAGRDAVLGGAQAVGDVENLMKAIVEQAGGVSIDYLRAVDADALTPASASSRRILLAGAIRVGGVRLIDNVLVERSTAGR